MTADAPKDCVLFLTHRWDGRLARHFEKLRREAGAVMPVYLVFHQSRENVIPAGLVPDLIVNDEIIRERFPRRYADFAANPPHSIYNNLDLIWLTAFLDPKLAAFDRLWWLENDVDYSGNWGGLFAATLAYPEDLIATFLRWRREEPRWMWLDEIVDPLNSPSDQLMGFFPASRFSRRAITAVCDAYANPVWRGHFELLIPTVVHRAGLSLAELGGWGTFTPPERRGRHYQGDFTTGVNGFYTFGAGPAMQHYYAESRLGFWSDDRLHHPVKTTLTGHVAFIAWWLKFRDRTRAVIARALGRPILRSGKY
jgi:hypothetical protein